QHEWQQRRAIGNRAAERSARQNAVVIALRVVLLVRTPPLRIRLIDRVAAASQQLERDVVVVLRVARWRWDRDVVTRRNPRRHDEQRSKGDEDNGNEDRARNDATRCWEHG